jgi:hypothetical protein
MIMNNHFKIKIMYNVITPAGTIKVETLKEAIEYSNLYGYPYQKIISAPESWRRQDEEFERYNDTDCYGNCFSDADPGL